MQVKKYQASSLRDATEQMKNELGDEAIILGTKILKDELYPVNKMFEITAGVDDAFVLNESFDSTVMNDKKLPRNFDDELKKISNKIYHASAEIEEELKSSSSNGKVSSTLSNKNSNREVIEDIVKRLGYNEIDRTIIKKIIVQLKKYGKLLQPANLESYVLSGIAAMIPTTEFKVEKGDEPKVVSLVGPTGVGKTTCIAKLAIISQILHNLDVGLVSIDTYRLGALDQLKVFSDVSNIDMLVAYEPEDLENIMNEFKTKDVVFIDTAGRSQKNEAFLTKAKKFLDTANVDESYLVMSSTSTARTMEDISEKFKMFDYKSLIFTKLDEGVVFGNMLNLINKINFPTIFLSNGQVIPDDIISADADYMARLIYNGKVS